MTEDRAVLRERIGQLSEVEDGMSIIRLQAVRDLAAEFDRPIREIELAALERDIVPRRYLRNLGTVGLDGQARLLRSAVAVVGLGGLGGYVVEALARMGVGRLILIDGDVFEDHNLNRQLLSAEARLGMDKVEAARQRVAEINGAVETIGHVESINRDNIRQLLKGAEVVVDALDRLPTRLLLQEGAQEIGVPMVHGSIAGFLGEVMTIFPDDLGLRDVYGEEPDLPERGLEAELGTPPATPMAVAAWEAQEVVKILTDRGKCLRNELLVMDMESGSAEFLRVGGG